MPGRKNVAGTCMKGPRHVPSKTAGFGNGACRRFQLRSAVWSPHCHAAPLSGGPCHPYSRPPSRVAWRCPAQWRAVPSLFPSSVARGVAVAQVLRTCAPDVPHLLHMPSHVDVLVGDYGAARPLALLLRVRPVPARTHANLAGAGWVFWVFQAVVWFFIAWEANTKTMTAWKPRVPL